MKKIFLSFALALFTGSALALNLGFNREEVAAQSTDQRSKWNSSQLIDAQKNCSESAIKSTDGKVSEKMANAYCQCAIGTSSQRYEYGDFAKNEIEYTEQMLKDGVIAKCAESAK
jgi:hypothetical protein